MTRDTGPSSWVTGPSARRSRDCFTPGANVGDLIVTVNGAGKGTFHVTGSVNILGEAGTNTVTINGTAGADAFVIDPADIVFNGTVFNGNSIQVWQVNGLGGDDTFTVHPGGAANINGGTGNNTLTGPNLTNNWSITGLNAGTLNTKVRFANVQNLVGGSGVDVFKILPAGKVTSIIGGGAPPNQGDWLDYSSFTTLQAPVTVNLTTGSATNVNGGAAGAVSNIQNVHGGNGGNTLTGDAQGNILIGGSGADTITGGAGLSLLIGDKGADHIFGGSGADILIGGYTTYDSMTTAHEIALMSILAEWQSADSYATRFHDIDTGTGGGLNGTNKLNFGTTVKDDGSANTLAAAPSSSALDWFFAGASDTIVNFETGEHKNNT